MIKTYLVQEKACKEAETMEDFPQATRDMLRMLGYRDRHLSLTNF